MGEGNSELDWWWGLGTSYFSFFLCHMKYVLMLDCIHCPHWVVWGFSLQLLNDDSRFHLFLQMWCHPLWKGWYCKCLLVFETFSSYSSFFWDVALFIEDFCNCLGPRRELLRRQGRRSLLAGIQQLILALNTLSWANVSIFLMIIWEVIVLLVVN